MGTSKAALFLDGIVAAARPVFDEVVAVDRLGGGITCDGSRTICETPHDGHAPIFGVVRALEDAGGPAFILAVDYPWITSEVLRFIRDDGRVPMWDGRPQMLCAVWSPTALPSMRDRIARGELNLRGVMAQEMIAETELRARFAGQPLKNVNTPEDWEGTERGQ